MDPHIQRAMLSKMKDVPTLPTIYSVMMDAMADPRASAQTVAEVLSHDQASAMRVLRLVNSAFFGHPGRIASIERAVMVLGFDEVKNLILATTILGVFRKNEPVLSFRPGDFWAHSVAVGLLSRFIGQAVGFPQLENYFVGGILHDIGKLLLFEYAAGDFAKALELADRSQRSIRDAELEVMGFDHCEIGALLAEQWRLPEALRGAIKYHHLTGLQGRSDPLIATIHIADFMARALELGFPGDTLVPMPEESAWKVVDLRPEALRPMLEAFENQYSDILRLLLKG